ncbi:nuclear transport factor 2 family protein [Streptomyces sp. MS1.AVA.1]|uniref:Nuclear transport factor 2 family protein n=1 Tax=Streptomyces machairae TaxID=3134109 RepID=A0ABU8UKR1_9ACTN
MNAMNATNTVHAMNAVNAMDPLELLLAERACERLVIDFVHRLDLGEPASVAELFTEDGTWEWPAGERLVEGRDALAAYFGSRPADRLSRRLMSNVLVTVTSPAPRRRPRTSRRTASTATEAAWSRRGLRFKWATTRTRSAGPGRHLAAVRPSPPPGLRRPDAATA